MFKFDPTPNVNNATFSTLDPLPEPLTHEELEELKRLLEEHDLKKKYKRLEEFKKLPPEIRQFYVNFVALNSYRAKIEDIGESTSKSERLKDLEVKYLRSGTCHRPHAEQWYLGRIEGISDEEAIKAHTEASLEESILEP